MHRPGSPQLCAQAVAHQLVQRGRGHLHAVRPREPGTDLAIAGKALVIESLLQGRQHSSSERALLGLGARGLDAQQLGQPALPVGREPAPDGVAVHGQMRGGRLAALDLSGAEQHQEVQALSALGIPGALEGGLEFRQRLGYLR